MSPDNIASPPVAWARAVCWAKTICSGMVGMRFTMAKRVPKVPYSAAGIFTFNKWTAQVIAPPRTVATIIQPP